MFDKECQDVQNVADTNSCLELFDIDILSILPRFLMHYFFSLDLSARILLAIVWAKNSRNSSITLGSKGHSSTLTSAEARSSVRVLDTIPPPKHEAAERPGRDLFSGFRRSEEH